MTEEKAYVFHIQRYSLQDGPGIRTTVFLKGCPLRCRWCCNPESQSLSPEQMGDKTAGTLMSVEEILHEVEKDEVFYRRGKGGMTVSGGEPLLQGNFTIELFREAKKRYLTTAIETSGFASRQVLLETAQYVDTIYYDIKSMDGEKHKIWTGRDNRIILDNFKVLRQMYPEKKLHVRTPVIPGFNDTEEEIQKICEFLQQYEFVDYELLAYHFYGKQKYEQLERVYPMGDAVLKQENFEKMKELVKRYGLGLCTAGEDTVWS